MIELTDRYEVLSRAYSNPTKISIMFLLAENNSMTVTQMSKYIDVSRSNLYHFVAQLVEDGVLNEPDIRPKKNYVEKYYSLNTETLGSVTPEGWFDHIASLTLEEFREFISSSLIGQSILLKMVAEKIAKTDESNLRKLKDGFKREAAWLSYSIIGRSKSEKVKVLIDRVVKELVSGETQPEEGPETELHRLLIMFLPLLNGGL